MPVFASVLIVPLRFNFALLSSHFNAKPTHITIANLNCVLLPCPDGARSLLRAALHNDPVLTETLHERLTDGQRWPGATVPLAELKVVLANGEADCVANYFTSGLAGALPRYITVIGQDGDLLLASSKVGNEITVSITALSFASFAAWCAWHL